MNESAREKLADLHGRLRGDSQDRTAIADAISEFLRRSGDLKIPPTLATALVDSLAGTSRSEQRRRSEILQALLPESSAVSAALGHALESPEADLRWGAAYTLGKSEPDNPRIWPALREMLAAEDGDSRWAAAEITCTMARLSPQLLDELRSATRGTRGDGATMRRMALYCLRDLQAEGLFEVARDRLDDPEGHVRLSALSTLTTTTIPDRQRQGLLEKLIEIVERDPVPGVQRSAVATIGKLHLHEARPVLEKSSISEDAGLARAARQALARWREGPL